MAPTSPGKNYSEVAKRLDETRARQQHQLEVARLALRRGDRSALEAAHDELHRIAYDILQMRGDVSGLAESIESIWQRPEGDAAGSELLDGIFEEWQFNGHLIREIRPYLAVANAEDQEYGRLAQSLAAMRQLGGLTQQALAAKLDLTKGAIRHYEHGRRRPTLDVIHAWASHCGFEFSYSFRPKSPTDKTRDHRHWLKESATRMLLSDVQDLSYLAMVLPRLPEPLRKDLRQRIIAWNEEYFRDGPYEDLGHKEEEEQEQEGETPLR